jgi:hypothetical protein
MFVLADESKWQRLSVSPIESLEFLWSVEADSWDEAKQKMRKHLGWAHGEVED